MKRIATGHSVWGSRAMLLVLMANGHGHPREASSSSLVGAWKGVVISGKTTMNVAFELKEDGTFVETIEVPKATFSGTYVFDHSKRTLTVTVGSTSDVAIIPVGTTITQDIAIDRDGRTFNASGGGSTGVFTKL